MCVGQRGGGSKLRGRGCRPNRDLYIGILARKNPASLINSCACFHRCIEVQQQGCVQCANRCA